MKFRPYSLLFALALLFMWAYVGAIQKNYAFGAYLVIGPVCLYYLLKETFG